MKSGVIVDYFVTGAVGIVDGTVCGADLRRVVRAGELGFLVEIRK